jgi:hypothetical protein
VRELGQALGRPAFIRFGAAEQLMEPPLPLQEMTKAPHVQQAGSQPADMEGGQ